MHLHTPLFVVLGHEGCGAVEAALATKADGAATPPASRCCWTSILPGLEGIDAHLPPPTAGCAAVEANVRWSMRQLLETPEGRERIREGLLKLAGAVYELDTGHVRFLE